MCFDGKLTSRCHDKTLSLTMTKFSVLTTLLLQLFCILVEVSGQHGCSQYFTYITDSSTREILGQVLIPFPPTNVVLHLRVALSIATRLSQTSIGQIGLEQSKEDSVQAVEQGRPLLYHIHFPVNQPIPVITGIWFNSQLYCTGSNALGSVVTSFVLEHSLYPPQIPLSQNISSNIQQKFRQIQTMGHDVTTSTTQSGPIESKPSSQPDQNNNECGRTFSSIEFNRLISNKGKISPGQWPWLVALFIAKINFELQCSGSLLTNRHILTAAHCFKLDSKTNIPPSAMLASLGRYWLHDWQQAGSINKEIENYIIHPEYQNQFSADSDLAVVILTTPVTYSSMIKPICLWSGPSDLQNVVNSVAYIVGWGKDETGSPYRTEPRIAQMPIVSQETCLWSESQFITLVSNRTFCAGSRDGTGPCNGDGGSGLMIQDRTTGRYYLRGVVSLSLYDSSKMTCDLTQYVVFVDVAKYTDWINQQISIT